MHLNLSWPQMGEGLSSDGLMNGSGCLCGKIGGRPIRKVGADFSISQGKCA